MKNTTCSSMFKLKESIPDSLTNLYDLWFIKTFNHYKVKERLLILFLIETRLSISRVVPLRFCVSYDRAIQYLVHPNQPKQDHLKTHLLYLVNDLQIPSESWTPIDSVKAILSWILK